MKRKFLITNDVGLALDKLGFILEEAQSEDPNMLCDYHAELLHIADHLQQALGNLVFEEDFDNV